MQRTSGLAITSMVCGIVSFFIPVVTSLAAIICGHLSRHQIKTASGALSGNGMALAGLICGYGSLIILTTVVCLVSSVNAVLKAVSLTVPP